MQYTFPLHDSNKYSENEFIFSNCNQELESLLNPKNNIWGYEPYPEIILLIGPSGSGKTHFCHILQSSNHMIKIIDDIDHMDEKKALHIFNECHENHQNALFTCKTISHFILPDLKSRLSSARNIKINLPDDVMIKALLIKMLAERSIKVSEDVIKYLLTHLPRSFDEISSAVDMIDKLSIEQKRNVGIRFVSELLRNKEK